MGQFENMDLVEASSGPKEIKLFPYLVCTLIVPDYFQKAQTLIVQFHPKLATDGWKN